MSVQEPWYGLMLPLKGRLFNLQGNDHVLRSAVRGFLAFLMIQNNVPIVHTEGGLLGHENLAVFDELVPEDGGYVVNLVEDKSLDYRVNLPCWSRFGAKNLERILRTLRLPKDLVHPAHSNFQEQIISALGFHISVPLEGRLTLNFKHLIFEIENVHEEIWDLLSSI